MLQSKERLTRSRPPPPLRVMGSTPVVRLPNPLSLYPNATMRFHLRASGPPRQASGMGVGNGGPRVRRSLPRQRSGLGQRGHRRQPHTSTMTRDRSRFFGMNSSSVAGLQGVPSRHDSRPLDRWPLVSSVACTWSVDERGPRCNSPKLVDVGFRRCEDRAPGPHWPSRASWR